jgi:hypothetical protein
MDPSTTEGAIFYGVVAGLITAAVLFILGLTFSKIVIPWYQNLIYKGVDLRGVWIREFDQNNAHYAIQLALSQSAHEVNGTGTFTKSGAGTENYVQFFTVSGSTWEGFLVITMRSTNRKSLSFVAGLLKIKDRGNALIGHWVYRGGRTDEAESEALHLVRQR